MEELKNETMEEKRSEPEDEWVREWHCFIREEDGVGVVEIILILVEVYRLKTHVYHVDYVEKILLERIKKNSKYIKKRKCILCRNKKMKKYWY